MTWQCQGKTKTPQRIRQVVKMKQGANCRRKSKKNLVYSLCLKAMKCYQSSSTESLKSKMMNTISKSALIGAYSPTEKDRWRSNWNSMSLYLSQAVGKTTCESPLSTPACCTTSQASRSKREPKLARPSLHSLPVKQKRKFSRLSKRLLRPWTRALSRAT